MKTRAQIHDTLDEWWEAGNVGNLIIYRAPHAEHADCIIEKVVKAREMPVQTRAAFKMWMDDLQVERGEVARNADGDPDRVKLTRRFDG
jgi:hypothetical protein